MRAIITFLVLLISWQCLTDPFGPGVVGLGTGLYTIQHGRELLHIIPVPINTHTEHVSVTQTWIKTHSLSSVDRIHQFHIAAWHQLFRSIIRVQQNTHAKIGIADSYLCDVCALTWGTCLQEDNCRALQHGVGRQGALDCTSTSEQTRSR